MGKFKLKECWSNFKISLYLTCFNCVYGYDVEAVWLLRYWSERKFNTSALYWALRCEGQNNIKWTKFCISFVPDKLSYFCEWWCYSYHWLTQALTQKQKREVLLVGVNFTTWRVVLLMLYYIPLTEDITNQSKFDIILFLNFILTHNIYQTHDLTLRH